MQTMTIQISDHYKLNSFFHELMDIGHRGLADKALGEQLLTLLSKIFGYEEMTFFLKKPGESCYFLIAHSIKGYFIESYMEGFHKLDPLNADNLTKDYRILENTSVVAIKDIMSYDEFNATEYYKQFLSKTIYYYETVMYLRHKEQVIGGIGILGRKTGREVSREDINLMNILSYYLSKLAVKYFLINDLVAKKNLFHSLSDQSPAGIIVFEANYPYRIDYMNSAAFRYTSELSPSCEKQTHSEKFITQHVIKDFYHNQFGVSKTILSHTNKPYFVNAVPSQATDRNSLFVYVYIIPQSGIEGTKKNRYLENNTNLTDRQLEIINCILQGKTNEEIAKELFISVHTVKTHLNNIYKEMNVTNRLSLYSKLVGN